MPEVDEAELVAVLLPPPEAAATVVACWEAGEAVLPLRAFLQERLAPAKARRELVLIDAVPRTPGGKALRRLLR